MFYTEDFWLGRGRGEDNGVIENDINKTMYTKSPITCIWELRIAQMSHYTDFMLNISEN